MEQTGCDIQKQQIKTYIMKKILTFLPIFIAFASFSQDLSGITVSLTIRAGDWAFIVGHRTAPGQDSTNMIYANRLRDTMLLANPANFNTNVRFNSLPAQLVYNIYVEIKNLPATLYDQVGTNISTQIKAISNTPLQNAITAFDNQAAQIYTDTRKRGKNFLSDH